MYTTLQLCVQSSRSRDEGLKAEFEVLAEADTEATLVLTEKSFVGTECLADNFGKGLTPFK